MMIMALREWLLRVLGCNQQFWEGQASSLAEQNMKLKLDNRDLQVKIKELQDSIIVEDDSVKPKWLDDQTPYIPVIEMEGETIQLKPQDIYMECSSLRDIALPWRKLPQDQKLMEIWKYVITALTYAYDKDDNWQPAIVTVDRKRGDCDDGTILFVTLCRIAHVRAESVFNACGLYDAQFGHSFPIIKKSDGKWYVAETTIDTIPSDFILLKGSKYDCSFGCANWKFAGKMKGVNQI